MVVNCKETFVPKGVAVYSATHISVVQGIRNEGSHLIHCVDVDPFYPYYAYFE